MIIMHQLAYCLPVKSPNYFTAEAPSNPLLNLPFKAKSSTLSVDQIKITMNLSKSK